MPGYKFDMRKIERLDDPGRLETLDPEVMWRALGRPSDARSIVDIGAGTGFFARRFAALAPHATVFAADVSDEMLAWMREKVPEVAEGRIEPLKAEETSIPLGDGVADLVYMINVHHELDDPEMTLAEAYRLLKPAGALLLVDWKTQETPKGPPMEMRVGAGEMVRQAIAAGFEEVRSVEALPWHDIVLGWKPV